MFFIDLKLTFVIKFGLKRVYFCHIKIIVLEKLLKLLSVFFIALIVSCGGNEAKKEGTFKINGKSETKSEAKKHQNELASKKVDLKNKGIGPIKSIELEPEIDHTRVTHGAELYKNKCTSCHRTDKKFIGPASAGVLNRRTPEWIMNLILNPQEMERKDHLTKELSKEFNNAIMPNQFLDEYEARSVLEYFRTLD